MASAAQSSIEVFRHVIDQSLTPDAIARQFAEIARADRDDIIARGDATPPYVTVVDGRVGAAEETVSVPLGIIRYLFGGDLPSVTRAAIQYLRNRSPVGRSHKGGLFKDSWMVLVDGLPWPSDNYSEIQSGSEVWITNPVPYSRKIEVGGMVTSRPPFLIEDARQFVLKEFKNMDAERLFVRLPTGAAQLPEPYDEIPYHLRRKYGIRSGLHWKLKGKGRGTLLARSAARPTNARDRTKGAEMSYPALGITERG